MDDARDTSGWLLAIDTSTGQAGLALTDGEQTAELSWPGGRTQTESVLAEIDHLRALLNVPVAGIRAIGVATGPGTFTGLRVGVSIAKGLALAGGLPVIGIPTLVAAAASCIGQGIPVAAVLPAGRGRVVWAIHDRDAATPAPRNTTFAQFVNALAERSDVLVAGELTAAQRAALAEAGHDRLVPPPVANRRPGALAALAWARWQAGDVDDLMSLQPVYLHGVVKQTAPVQDRL